MKTSILKFIKKGLFMLAIGGIALTSCKKEEEKAAPALPSMDTMEMSMTDFQKSGKQLDDHSNWFYAAANVTIWHTVLTLNMAVPVASFREAFNHKGVYHAATDEWIWDYNAKVAGIVYTCSLHAQENGSNIEWKMYISQAGGFSNVLWYSGISAKDGLSGSWKLNKDGNNPTAFLDIQWKKNSANTEANITYTNIIPNDPGNGGYIEYGIQTGDLDHFYNIFLKQENKLTEIEWNKAAGHGRVKDAVHFGDTAYHCWDSNAQNIDCK